MKLTKLILPSCLLFLSVPAVSAAELGDALQRTFEADQWSYSSKVLLEMQQNPELDMPFDASFTVLEEGGKIGTEYAEKGTLTADVSNIETSEWSDFDSLNAEVKYRADYEDRTQTGYVLLDSFKIRSSTQSFQKTIDMLNEMTKMVTGKAFKMSTKQLTEALASQFPGMMNEEDLLTLNAFGGQSIQTMMSAFAEAFDGLIESGVLVDQVASNNTRRRSGEASEIHVLTLGKSISPEQAKTLQSTLIRFLEQMAPMLAADASAEIRRSSAEELAEEINEALTALDGTDLQLQFEIVSGLLRALDFNLDLTTVEVPMMMSGNVIFDYTQGYASVVPREEKNLIDLNKIIEGFVSMVGISSSVATPTFGGPYDDYDFGNDYDYDTSYYLVIDTIDEIDNFLWNICGEDVSCRRSQLKSLRRDLRQLRREGVVTTDEYRWKMEELNSLR